MEAQRQTKMVAFCCPQHGSLSSLVEYFSVDFNSKKLVSVPVKYCYECKKYYTPFSNLLALVRLRYRGCEVSSCKAVGLKGMPQEKVRVPYFIENVNYYQEQEKLRKEQLRKERAEKYRKYIEGLREVDHDSIILINKPSFIKENKCPSCHSITRKEYVKIKQRRKYVLANVRYCSCCDSDYISPTQFYSICEKAEKQIRGYYDRPFVSPIAIRFEFQSVDKYLFIPMWALDTDKYDYYHLPPKGDTFYDMSAEEYSWVIEYHQPIDFDFPVQLRSKSFLGEAGYSTAESEIRRHAILERCVSEYGKWKVISQLKSNMNIRLQQKNGEVRYANAINIWRSDIWYVENKL